MQGLRVLNSGFGCDADLSCHDARRHDRTLSGLTLRLQLHGSRISFGAPQALM